MGGIAIDQRDGHALTRFTCTECIAETRSQFQTSGTSADDKQSMHIRFPDKVFMLEAILCVQDTGPYAQSGVMFEVTVRRASRWLRRPVAADQVLYRNEASRAAQWRKLYGFDGSFFGKLTRLVM